MVTGELKNRIDALWDIFYAGGLSNPLLVIEQITYLMFIHDLGKLDEQRESFARALGQEYVSIFDEHEEFRWTNLLNITKPSQLRKIIAEELFPFIKNLNSNKESAFSRYMENATFLINDPKQLILILKQMENIYNLEDCDKSNMDIKGDIYEYMLSKLGESGVLGQFRTPRNIIGLMVNLIKPLWTDLICDPACGTAGFLVESANYLKSQEGDEKYNADNLERFHNSMFTGYDIDPTMLRLAAMNMMQHNIENPNINFNNGLSNTENKIDESDKYSLILANPPFSGSLDKDSVPEKLSKLVNTKKTEILFLAQFLRLLRQGGRAAVIVPDGVLFGSSKAHIAIRKEIVENHILKAVISLPSGVFKPYSGVSTSILIFTKTGEGGTDYVWFYDMHADGFSLDDKRQPTEANDIPDIIERYNNLDNEHKRARTEQSFFVPKTEIAENNYDLTINKYKQIVYEQEEIPSSEELMLEITQLQAEYNKELDILRQMLVEQDKE